MARMTKQQKAAEKAKRDAIQTENVRILNTGKCPQCEAKLRHNSAILGWYQCSQYGAEGFRADSNKPSCSFQMFINYN